MGILDEMRGKERWLLDAHAGYKTILVVSANILEDILRCEHLEVLEIPRRKRMRFLWYVDDFPLFNPLEVMLRREFLFEG